MKNIILFISIFLSFPSQVNAENTWVRVSHLDFSKAAKGTLGYGMCKEGGVCGIAMYVDAKSIVRKGQYVYFNFSSQKTDRRGDVINKKPWEGTGWEADCVRRLLKGPAGRSNKFESYDGLGEFVCR